MLLRCCALASMLLRCCMLLRSCVALWHAVALLRSGYDSDPEGSPLVLLPAVALLLASLPPTSADTPLPSSVFVLLYQ
jgi:hypothetical protein